MLQSIVVVSENVTFSYESENMKNSMCFCHFVRTFGARMYRTHDSLSLAQVSTLCHGYPWILYYDLISFIIWVLFFGCQSLPEAEHKMCASETGKRF